MNRIIVMGFSIIAVAILLPALLSIGIRLIPENTQPSLTTTERIYSDSIVGQAFDAFRDNLSGIGLSIKNPNYQNKKDLTVELLDNNGRVLRSRSINGASIADGDYVKFIFDPVHNSNGKRYNFTVSASQADVSEALEVFYSDKPNLSFVALYRPKNIISLNTEIYENILTNLAGSTGFFIFWIAGVVIILGLITHIRFQISKSK